MIEIKNLSAGYGAKSVLRSITVNAKAGEFIALLGPNGSGKTTLLKTLIGLHKPASGTVQIDGADILDMPAKKRAKQIAYLAQHVSPAWDMSARDVVTLGRAPYRGALGKLSPQGLEAVNAALSSTQTEALSHRNVNTLSGGERARVLLARALAVQAPVLLADEPIAALDPYYQITIMRRLQSEAQSGKLVITALHDLALASQFCDRVIVLHDGVIAADGSPDAALSDAILARVFGISRPDGGFGKVDLAPPPQG